ncbi:MAG TPA: hypothetical protein VF498_15745 [Anaerolineales bacterium]
MKINDLYPLVLDAFRELGSRYSPAMQQAAAQFGLDEPHQWFLLLTAQMFDPEAISPERLRMRSPYTATQAYQGRLEGLASRGLLTPSGKGEFRMTKLGRQTAQRIIEAAYNQMAALETLPEASLERLAALLRRLVGASLKAAEPPGKWSLLHSRLTDPGDDANVLVRIDQYLTDLAAYRDDAHLASWQPFQINGQVWEALTLLWRSEATNLDELYQKLQGRGYSQASYNQALRELVNRGWAAEVNGKYRLTLEGQELRQTAEQTTDRYFYAPWVCLDEADEAELRSLLVQLAEV